MSMYACVGKLSSIAIDGFHKVYAGNVDPHNKRQGVPAETRVKGMHNDERTF